MSRYIDADLLTETMRNRYDEICDTYGYHDLYASGYDDAVDAVENAPTADVAPRAEWISVEERLPDGNGRFLTVDKKGDMMVCYWEKRFGWFASVCNKNAITHWMHLPEPPEANP